MDQRSTGTALRACHRKRCGLRGQEREDDGDTRDSRRHEPDEREVAVAEHGLADQRADREPEIEGQRQEAESLAATVRRRQIAGGSERSDEEEPLPGTEKRPREHEDTEVDSNEVEDHPGHGQHGAADEQRPAPESV